ncbi:hypothetical protein CDD82_7445 [Ophiocordyceps australis]|uniref:Uncharacterized protein n=1 Tax=Ophiocordyceps australis TaxID=1399860 RepID=A0A2C5YV29_9HYPO|nr:hypothetical protein CDD82_7445 [Ophiocordyceps australis]
MRLFKTLIAAGAPVFVTSMVSLSWSVSNAPKDGLNDIAFSFNMANAPHSEGYYFAQQFGFINQEHGAYCGLQPRPDRNGQAVFAAIFSSFIQASSTQHENCRSGADNGPGVSCYLEMDGEYRDTYEISVEQLEDDMWRGTITDTETRNETVIGEWSLPKGSGKIKASFAGFVEYYPWNREGSDRECDKLPKSEAFFGQPTTTTPGAAGSIADIHDYGPCKGKIGFVSEPSQEGTTIKTGFT